ncbi:MAG: hypothetical protein IIB71_10160 [Proteobacteria bacterium]|nr:hypothetical protein [Pseudomonadota bacterium]
MTDDQIVQYLENLNLIYTEEMQARLEGIRDEMNYIGDALGQLNLDSHRDIQETVEDELERLEAIDQQKIILIRQQQRLHSRRHATNIEAEMRGVQKEKQNISDMPRHEINDIQLQAELLNILDNRILQLQKASQFIMKADISGGYTLSFGDTAVLRGAWEDAEDAVQLTIGVISETFDEPEDSETKEGEEDSDSEKQKERSSPGADRLSGSKNYTDPFYKERSAAFDPLPISGIARMFPLKIDEEENQKVWKGHAARAARNGLKLARIIVNIGRAKSTFDPLFVSDWLIARGDFDRAKADRKLASNLPPRSAHLADLFRQ